MKDVTVLINSSNDIISVRKVPKTKCNLCLLCIHIYSYTCKFKNRQNPQDSLNVTSDTEKTELKAAEQLSDVILLRPVFTVFIQLLCH